MSSPLIGWIVGWPNREDCGQVCGYGEIVAVEAGAYLIVRVIIEADDDEPPHHRVVCLHDQDIVLFHNEEDYITWIEHWRRDRAEQLRYTRPHGRA